MAQQTLVLPEINYTVGSTGSAEVAKGWNFRSGGRPSIDSSLLPAGETANLHILYVTATNVLLQFIGDDLTAAFETSGGIDITVGGNVYSFDLNSADTDEPYDWAPSNQDDVAALYAVLASATAGTLVIRDFPATPDASAGTASVSINTIANGNEGTSVQLGATLTKGTGVYDGVSYAWTASAGTLTGGDTATPTWTRPNVNSNTNVTIGLTVTLAGDGTTAKSGTSVSLARVTRTATVLNVLPVAVAPAVSINAVAAGDEGTTVTLGATVGAGGQYDGSVTYAWTVEGGTLNDATAAAPVWTRPAVGSDTNFDIDLQIEVSGDGTTTRNGTSDTTDATQVSATVRDVPPALPVASAGDASASIDAVAAGDEEVSVRLGATVTKGTGVYDTVSYAWTADAGALTGDNTATPTWTRPTVSATKNVTLRLVVTLQGTGTTARSGTSVALAEVTRSALVRDVPAPTVTAIITGETTRTTGQAADYSATIGGTATGAETYQWQVRSGTSGAWSDADTSTTYSLMQSVAGTWQVRLRVTRQGVTGTSNVITTVWSAPAVTVSVEVSVSDSTPETGDPVTWSRTIGGTATGVVTQQWQRRAGITGAWSNVGTGTTYSTSRNTAGTWYVRCVVTRQGVSATSTPVLATWTIPLPTASAGNASVSINAIAAGDEGTAVDLSATVTKGTGVYDTVTYAWTADEGTLTGADTATPRWTRPAVTSTQNVTIRLTVTLEGDGTTAKSGTSVALAEVTRLASVRDVPMLPYQVFDLEAAEYVVGTVSKRWLKNPRPLVQANLCPAGQTRYLDLVVARRENDRGGVFHFEPVLTGTRTSGHDLSAQVESTGIFRITVGDTHFDFPVNLDSGGDEPYAIDFSGATQTAYNAWQTALSATAGDEAGTLTIWDGTGTSPFAPAIEPVEIAGIGTLTVGADSVMTVTSPAPDAITLGGIGSLAIGADSALQVDSSSAIRPAGIGSLAIGADAKLSVVTPDPDTTISGGFGSLPIGGASALDIVTPVTPFVEFTLRYTFNSSAAFIAPSTISLTDGSLPLIIFNQEADNWPANAPADPEIVFLSSSALVFSGSTTSGTLQIGALNITVARTLVSNALLNPGLIDLVRIRLQVVGGDLLYNGPLVGTSSSNYANLTLRGDAAQTLYDFARASGEKHIDAVFSQAVPPVDLHGGIGSSAIGADSEVSVIAVLPIEVAGVGTLAVSFDADISVVVPTPAPVAGIGSLAISSDTELSITPPAQIDVAGRLRRDLFSADLPFAFRRVLDGIGIAYDWAGSVVVDGLTYAVRVHANDGSSVTGLFFLGAAINPPSSVTLDYQAYRIEVEDAAGEVAFDFPASGAVTTITITQAQFNAMLGATPATPGNREMAFYFPQTATIPTPAIASDAELNVVPGAAINPAGIGSLAITFDTALGITPATPVRVAGVGTLAFGADSQLQIDSSSAIRAQGIGSLAINSDTTLAVVPPTAIRPAGIPSLAVASDSELYVDPASATRIRGVGTEAIDAETELSVVEPTPARPAGIPSLAVTVGSQLRVLATAAIRLAGIGTAAFSAEAVAQVIPPTTITPSGIATAAVSVDSMLNVIRRVVPDSTTNLPLTIRYPKLSPNFWRAFTSDLEMGEFGYDILDTSASAWPEDEDTIILWLYAAELATRINRVDSEDENSAIEDVFLNFDLFDFFLTLDDFSGVTINNVDFASDILDNMKITVVTSTAVTLFEGDYPANKRVTLTGDEASTFVTFEAGSDIYIDVTYALKRTNVNGGFGSLAITGDSAVDVIPPTPVRPAGVATLLIDSDAGLDITRPDEVRIGGARRSNLAMLTLRQSPGQTIWSLSGVGFQVTAAPALRLFGTGQYRADATARFDITHPTTGLVFEALLSDYPDGRNAGITQAQYDAIFGPGTNVNNLDSRGFAPYLPDTTETPSAVVSVDTALDITTPTSVRIAGIGSVAFSGDSVLQISSILQILPITVILPWSSTNTWVSDPANTEQRLFAGTAANRAITVSRSARNLSVSITGDTDFADEVEDEGVIFSLYLGGRTFVLFEDVTEDHPYTYRISIAERNALRGANPDETLLAMVFTRPPPIYVPEAIGEEGFSTDSALAVTRVAAVSVSGIGSEAVTAENVIRVFRVAGVRLGGIGTVAFAADSAVSTITPATIRLAGIATLDITVDAPRLQIDGPGNIRIAGAGFLPVSVDSEVRAVRPIGVGVAGIGSLAFAGDSALVVEESEIPIPEGITEGSTGDITFGDYRLQWSQGFDETYRFRTGIITHRGGTEQRIAHRSRPRVEYEFTAFLDPVEMRTFLARNSANQGALTYFPHPRDTVVSPTELGVGASFVSFDPVPGWLNAGSSLFVRFGQYVIPGVALGVDAAGALLAFSNPAPLPAGTLIYRGAPARPSSSPSIAAATSRVGTMQLRVDGDPVDNWLPTYPATAPVALDGKEYFDLGPNWNDGVSIGMPEEWEDIDFERGAVSRRFPNLFPKRLLQYRYLLHTPERIEHVLGLFFRMRGRQKSFYMPSFVHEATLAENTTRTQFTVPGNQFFRTYADSPVFKWLRIVHQAGVYLVEVDSITQTDEGNSEVTLTDQMPASLTPAEIRMISWVNLVRFETDSLTVNWRTDGVAETRLNLRTLEIELPT